MYNCKKCDKEFNTTQSLNAHQVSHKEGSRYKARKPYRNKKTRIKSSCCYCGKMMEYLESKPRTYCCNQCQQNHRVDETIKSGDYTKSTAFTYFKRTTTQECVLCGQLPHWNGKDLVLQIDHIDGDTTNNKLENLRYICPNCHTQTETWGVKNISKEGKERLKKGALKGALITNTRTCSSKEEHPPVERKAAIS